MSKTILITGGATSGKTRWAISYLEACDYVLYLCTDSEMDPDTKKRIEFNLKQHPVDWEIKTGVNENPAETINDHRYVIFDNLASYTLQAIKKICPDTSKLDPDTRDEIENKIIGDITDMYEKTMSINGNMIVITLETGFSVTPENPFEAAFREILGNVNQRTANMFNDVYMSASGVQFQIK